MQELYGAPEKKALQFLAALAGAVLTEGVLLLSVRKSLKRTDRLSAVDALAGWQSRKKEHGKLVRLNREGATILLVTHDSKVAAACSRILYLLDGMIEGELLLADTTETKAREEAVGNWLADMGW